MSDNIAAPPPRKLLPPHAFVLSLAAQLPAMIVAWPLRPGGFELYSGVVLMLAGFGLNVWADRVFRQRNVGVRPFSPAAQLVEDGPFRYSRNPMYLGLVLFSAGLALATGLLVNLVFPALLAGWLQLSFITAEERFLAQQFGDRFAAYCRRIPKWIGIPKGAVTGPAPPRN
jgi:protein-S-isoprenylcysteine O-methyltransferase Ste14